MCDGPKCGWCGVPILEEERRDVTLYKKDGTRIVPAAVKKDFTVLRDQNFDVYHVQKSDEFAHKGECDEELMQQKRVRAGSAA